MKKLVLLISHGCVGLMGIALGIYLLPLMIAQAPPTSEQMSVAAKDAVYQGAFVTGLQGSDWLHWGQGKVSLTETQIVFQGELAPGPDYKLYLSPQFVEEEAAFLSLKPQMVEVADVGGFDGFIIDLPAGIDIHQYSTVVIWCESFGEFITAARYR